jgi:hypothetical protein
MIGVVLLGIATLGWEQTTQAEVTAEQVNTAIERGKAFLKRHQRADGSWAERPGYDGGVTALCTLALLNAGVEPRDDSIQKALRYLQRRPRERTYVVALITMVFCKASPDDKPFIVKNVRWLETNQIKEGPTKGSWSYPVLNITGDNSNSQFALLALHEAERIGVPVDVQTWRRAEEYWEKVQNIDGSWGYVEGVPGTGSMTCAGIASLVITGDKIGGGNARAEGRQIRCCLPGGADDSPVNRGLEWLGRRTVFAVTHNPGSPGNYLLYYLYALERVGRLTARRFIGDHDWYREGAEHLLRIKGGETSDHWMGVGAVEQDPRIATSFALLFLSKGRWPVLLSKLKHGAGDDWNAHRNDVNNLTRYVESQWEQDLTWQVVDLKAAKVEDLLESPVLYLCGSEDPLPATEAEQQDLARKLRDYLDRSGFLFAEGYQTGSDFDRGFRKLMELAFPEPEYRLAPIPPGHVIWHHEEEVPAEYVRPLWGIEYGCRTSVVYCPPDASGRPSLSCLWEVSRSGRGQQLDQSVKDRIHAGLAIGNNVLAYATTRTLKFKDPSRPEAVADQPDDPFTRGKLYIANVQHAGGCNAAPRALITLLETAQKELDIRTGAEHRDVSLTDDALFDYHLVFMHGRNTFHLTDAERKQLRTFVERGGLVFANSICASEPFTRSFRREMAAVFPDHPLEPIPKDDPLWTWRYGGFDLPEVTRRDPQRSARNEPLKAALRKGPPDLEGVKLDDRYGVIYSRYDLSCALEKHDSVQCRGYLREDAARISMNVVFYSLQQ